MRCLALEAFAAALLDSFQCTVVDAVVMSFELSTGRGARNLLDPAEARGSGAGGHEQVFNVAAQGPTQPGTVQPVASEPE